MHNISTEAECCKLAYFSDLSHHPCLRFASDKRLRLPAYQPTFDSILDRYPNDCCLDQQRLWAVLLLRALLQILTPKPISETKAPVRLHPIYSRSRRSTINRHRTLSLSPLHRSHQPEQSHGLVYVSGFMTKSRPKGHDDGAHPFAPDKLAEFLAFIKVRIWTVFMRRQYAITTVLVRGELQRRLARYYSTSISGQHRLAG